MAATVTGPALVKTAAGPAPLTPDQRYWRSFGSQLQISSPSSASISSISSAPFLTTQSSSRHDLFAVTTGTRVQIYSGRTRRLLKTIQRFTDTAHSGEIRSDGKLLVAGDDTGAIQVFDISSRAILKTWTDHKQPVWVTNFSPVDPTSLMSACDDKTVRLWDLPSEKPITTMTGHTDYVRTGSFMSGNSTNMLLSGSYDGTVKLWDTRTPERAAVTFQHGSPVEAVLPMPSGTMVLAATDNKVSVLDLVAGRPLKLLQNHQKTVTALCLASKGERVLSAGLDGQVKVYETGNWNVLYSARYSAPILSMSVQRNQSTLEDSHLVVGMQSGLLSIRTKLSGKDKERERAKQKEMKALVEGTIEEHDRKLAKKKRGKGWEKALRGTEFKGQGTDMQIDSERVQRKKPARWELNLQQGRYAQALDDVLTGNYQPSIVLTMLTALRHRSATRTALAGRDEMTLQPILKSVTRMVGDPRYVVYAVDLGLQLLELYAGNLGQSAEVDSLVRKLHSKVSLEVERAEQACQTGGMLEMFLAKD